MTKNGHTTKKEEDEHVSLLPNYTSKDEEAGHPRYSRLNGATKSNNPYSGKSREELIARIVELEKRKKYGLNYEYHPEDVVEKCLKKSPVLKEDFSKEIFTNSSLPTNLLIEGDNYHSLSVLNYTHKQKIDIIYIDPPYNTGATDWKYNDRFVKKDDDFRHSKWLSMMQKRLQLAKNLLRPKGVIFISIDDNEHAHLKMLMDEIFGDENFVTTLHVEMSTTQGMKVAAAQKGTIVKNAEYVLCYCRDKNKLSPFNKLYEAKDWDKHYHTYYNKKTGKKKTLKSFIDEVEEKGILEKSSQNDIAKRYSDDMVFRDFIHKNSNNIYRDAMCKKSFSFSYEQRKNLDKGKIITYTDAKNKSYLIFINSNTTLCQLLSLDMAIGDTDGFTRTYGLRKIRGDWWKDFYKDMMNVAKEGEMEFKNGKKPVRLLKDIVKLVPNDQAVVLDFFAGSGTTGHAALELNKEDGGSRQFILCTNNENEIAEKVTYPRIRNVIKGYWKKAKEEAVKLEGNLKYYKTGFAPGGSSDADRRILADKAVEMLCVKENTFAVEVDHEQYKIYSNNNQYTFIILASDVDSARPAIIEDCKKEISKIKLPCVIYLFSHSSEPDSEEFAEFGNKVDVKPIPEAILQIYRRIFR